MRNIHDSLNSIIDVTFITIEIKIRKIYLILIKNYFSKKSIFFSYLIG